MNPGFLPVLTFYTLEQILQQTSDALVNLDRQLLLFINSHYNSFFDFVMYWLSDKLIWAPLYVVLLVMMYYTYRKGFWYILLLIILLVALTDQVSVVLFKDVFQRLRPCHEPELEGMVRILNGHCGGSYGFISSHACNTFGVAVFAGSLLKIKYKWILPVLLCWAATISYSRVYLGVHYPGDVLVGALVGAFIGWVIVSLFNWIQLKLKIREKAKASV